MIGFQAREPFSFYGSPLILSTLATGSRPSFLVRHGHEVGHMVRAMRAAPVVAPAPESLQGMLRLAAQLEALADSQAPHRKAATRAILPPATAANHTIEVAASAKVAVRTLPGSQAVWQATSPPLVALLPFVVLLVVLVVVPAFLLVLQVARLATQSAAGETPAAASQEPKQMTEGKTVPRAPDRVSTGVDSELVLELVLSSQEGSNGRPRQHLLQRARQLSSRHAPALHPSPIVF